MRLKLSQEHAIMLFLSLVVLASGTDLISDLSQGVSTAHIIQEGCLFLFAILTLGWLLYDNIHKKKMIQRLNAELAAVKAQPPAASDEVLRARRQFADAIAEQFGIWQLTASEQEVGLLLLKGFSLKEISALRGTAEKTIRQQASSIYQKSGLSGRHAFSAWFIEDFL